MPMEVLANRQHHLPLKQDKGYRGDMLVPGNLEVYVHGTAAAVIGVYHEEGNSLPLDTLPACGQTCSASAVF
jgi:hypothetical protein